MFIRIYGTINIINKYFMKLKMNITLRAIEDVCNVGDETETRSTTGTTVNFQISFSHYKSILIY